MSEEQLQEVLAGYLAKAEAHRADMGDKQATVEHLVRLGRWGQGVGWGAGDWGACRSMGDKQVTVEHLVRWAARGWGWARLRGRANRLAVARPARLGSGPGREPARAPTCPLPPPPSSPQVLALAEDPRFAELLGCTTSFQVWRRPWAATAASMDGCGRRRSAGSWASCCVAPCRAGGARGAG
jgi:hypothetical protein